MPSLQSLLQQGCDAPLLFSQHGYSTAEIAAGMGCSARWVRKLIARAGVRPAKKPEPTKLELYRILLREVARHGGIAVTKINVFRAGCERVRAGRERRA